MTATNKYTFNSLFLVLIFISSLGLSFVSQAAITVIKADALVDVQNSKIVNNPIVIIENNVIQYVWHGF